jgi:transcriptional regulator with XRE-family HTH domain
VDHRPKRNPLGQLIKQKRKELAITQRALAEKLGVESSHVAYLESGQRKPSLMLMAELEAALGISRQKIFLLAHPEAAVIVNPIDRSPLREGPADVWRRLRTDRAFIIRHRMNRRELQAFEQLSRLGYVLSRYQVLAILTMIREHQDG